MNKLSLSLLFALYCVMQTALAAEGSWTNPLLTEKFYVGGGGIFYVANTEADLDTDTTPGTTIDFEDVLNLDEDVTNFFGKVTWRISPKHKLDLEYFSVNRDGGRTLTENITIDGDNIALGASTNSSFDVDLARVGYNYSFINDGQKELGVGIGLHMARFSFDFNAQGSVNGTAGSVSTTAEDMTLPLPNFGVNGIYAFNENIAINARANAFYLSIDEYSGYIVDIAADAVYSFNDTFGVAAGMSSFYVNFDADGGDFQGGLGYWLWGPRAYVYMSF